MVELSEERFEEIVAQTLDDVPEWISHRMQNVAIVIRPWPSPQQVHKTRTKGRMLLGLYEGVPLTRRGHAYRLVPPDRITLFQQPLQRAARDQQELVQLVRRTVIHEIGHHFGLSEKDLSRLGL
ncbi:MAG: metallopeptidase family protein [Chloroflexota bacterium]|nr:metallopeptidase family protein [Chloroflexota bacterium]